MKKKIKTIKKETLASRKDDQFGVILENINSKIDLILESHDAFWIKRLIDCIRKQKMIRMTLRGK